jgi:Bacteriophage Lambda NinG protein
VRKPKEKTLKAKLDEIYSRWLRRSNANEQGNITCYCGAVVPWEESDCSHYIPRGCLALRYDVRNTTPSCRRCNRFMGGNLQAYALYLERRYGTEILQTLEKEKHKITKNFPYQILIDFYSEELRKTPVDNPFAIDKIRV